MQKIGIILDNNDNTLILGKDKSLLRFNEIKEVKKLLRKRLIFRPILVVFSNKSKEELDIKKINHRKAYYCERSKAILLGKDIDITKSSVTLVIDINNDINISAVSLGKVIINKSIDIDDFKVDKLIKIIEKELDNFRLEIIDDIKEKGIILTGNNQIIDKLANKLRKKINIPIFISNDYKMDCVTGVRKILDNLSLIDY